MKKYLIGLCLFGSIVGSQIWAENMKDQENQISETPAAQQQEKLMVVSGKKRRLILNYLPMRRQVINGI